MKKALVIGAGVSGLSAAFALKKSGATVTLLEKSNGIGGALQTVEADGYLAEKGPNSMQVTSQAMADALDELGLQEDIIRPHEAAKKRYLVKNRVVTAAPMGPMDLLKTPLFSAKGKLRLLREPFVAKGTQKGESLAQFVTRRLGSEVLDYAVNPFISGVYAGRPEKLSAEHAFPSLWKLEQDYGSLIKGGIKSRKEKRKSGTLFKPYMVSFKNGMHTLAHSLLEKLKDSVQTNVTIQSIEQEKQKWIVKWHDKSDSPLQETVDTLIIATPAFAIASLPFSSAIQQSVAPLSELEYPPVASLVLGFKKEDIKHPLDGFGALVPEKENKQILGAIFSSTLFENRAPQGHHLLSVFIGGARQPELTQLNETELLKHIRPDLESLFGITGTPTFQHHTCWERAIPQYNLGYERFLHTIESVENNFPGLIIIGNHRNGISVGQCLMNGLNVAV